MYEYSVLKYGASTFWAGRFRYKSIVAHGHSSQKVQRAIILSLVHPYSPVLPCPVLPRAAAPPGLLAPLQRGKDLGWLKAGLVNLPRPPTSWSDQVLASATPQIRVRRLPAVAPA
ncbi:hypothetical protein IF2G_06360 [Cordyceps javanica]|nr:hypothetical protein IF2G_06360 [Cordyceps javanica]